MTYLIISVIIIGTVLASYFDNKQIVWQSEGRMKEASDNYIWKIITIILTLFIVLAIGFCYLD